MVIKLDKEGKNFYGGNYLVPYMNKKTKKNEYAVFKTEKEAMAFQKEKIGNIYSK